MANPSPNEAAESHFLHGQLATKKLYEAMDGEEGFKGEPLLRKVYNDLLARRQKKNNIEINSAWTDNMSNARAAIVENIIAEVQIDENKTSRSQWTIPAVPGVIMMPRVDPLPPTNCWQYSSVNFPSKDSKFLNNMPSVNGSDAGSKFNKELLQMDQGKVHSEHECDDASVIDPVVLPDFIRVLMKLEEDYQPDVFSDERVTENIPDKKQLRLYYRSVQDADELEFATHEPSKKVLKAAMSVINEDMTTNDLKKRYFRLAKRRCPAAYRRGTLD